MKAKWKGTGIFLYVFSSQPLNLKRLKSHAFGMLYNINYKVVSNYAILWVYIAVVKAYHFNFLPSSNAMKHWANIQKIAGLANSCSSRWYNRGKVNWLKKRQWLLSFGLKLSLKLRLNFIACCNWNNQQSYNVYFFKYLCLIVAKKKH